MSQYSNVEVPGFVLAFSNPNLSHPADPDLKLGVPGDEPSSEPDGPADAVRHLNEVRQILTNVRAGADADPCRYELTGDDGVLPTEGATYRVHLETGPDCAWTASGGEWVESVLEASGTGSGEIAFTVTANDGWERPVELLVSGKLHARRQAGSRPITPVCERSDKVRGRLMVLHPDWNTQTSCRHLNFDAAYLASLRHLALPGNEIYNYNDSIDGSELRLGDFDGLTGLVHLRLSEVESLPPDLFSGLIGLKVLNFRNRSGRNTTLASIEPGAFRGLPGLVELSIGGHRVGVFKAGTFEGLPRLRELLVWGRYDRAPDIHTPSTTFEPGAFAGLSDLRYLAILRHRVASLEAGVFDDLGRLQVLKMRRNELRSLAPGVFDGMSDLVELELHLNLLTTLPSGVFDDLSSLKRLDVWENRLTGLPDGVFDGMPNLEFLYLSYNSLRGIEAGSFANQRSLKILDLGHNALTRLEPDLFSTLSELEWLNLTRNALSRLPTGLFGGLGSLERLWLSSNRLGALRAGTFDGLASLVDLYLYNAGVTSLEAGVFDSMPALRYLQLEKNRLRNLAPGVLRGVRGGIDLRANPGTPFTFAPRPVLIPGSEPVAGQPVNVALEIASAEPFAVHVPLAASGGLLSVNGEWVPAGVDINGSISAMPDGDGPVTVRIDGPLRVRSPCPRNLLFGNSQNHCYRGARLAAGPPLVLYGFADRQLTLGRGAETIDLVGVFSYFLGAADYTASSSDEAVAAVTVEDGTLTVTPGAAGTAEVTVTATGPGGETVTRNFAVAVRIASVPLLLSGSNVGREGFVRLINHSDNAGEVRITAIDDGGTRRDPVTLGLSANAVTHFNTGDLERGNAAKGLTGDIGFGEGDWRLEFESALDLEALAYVRTADGFLTGMHDLAPVEGDSGRVATFNPADNDEQASRLRVINPGREAVEVTVRGVDDTGASPGGAVRFEVPAGGARTLTAAQLETGGEGLHGALGDGEGKWRLLVESEPPVQAMSLLENVLTGHLTNLSSVPVPPDGEDGVHQVPLFPAASDPQGRQGFARMVNRSEREGTVQIVAIDRAGERYGPLELALGAGETAHFNSEDLELGNAAKGLSGSTGAGDGDWRLELTSDLDIEALSYIRMEDGFLTTMHDVVIPREGHRGVAIFNPGSNPNQVSRLRLVNPAPEPVVVTIIGTDDAGRSPDGEGAARVTVPAGSALSLTAAELEAGIPSEIEGWYDYWDQNALGDGYGKWRLAVAAEAPIRVLSLLESPTGHLTNLSSVPMREGVGLSD